MGKDVKISILLDIYGNVLTEKQRDALDLYYNQDFSLSEISEHYNNITRQGVRDFIERGKSYLFELEDKMKLFEKFNIIQNDITQIIDISQQIIQYNEKYCYSSAIHKYTEKINLISKKIADELN